MACCGTESLSRCDPAHGYLDVHVAGVGLDCSGWHMPIADHRAAAIGEHRQYRLSNRGVCEFRLDRASNQLMGAVADESPDCLDMKVGRWQWVR